MIKGPCFKLWEPKEHVCAIPEGVDCGSIVQCNKCRKYWLSQRHWYNGEEVWVPIWGVVAWFKIWWINLKNKRARKLDARPC